MTREEAIKRVKRYLTDCLPIVYYGEVEEIIEVLEQEPRWIPTSERYPKPDDEYKFFLVTDAKGRVRVEEFYISLDEEPQPYFSGMANVIAWMPLPNAYREVDV